MRIKLFTIASVVIFSTAVAQEGSSTSAVTPAGNEAPATTQSSGTDGSQMSVTSPVSGNEPRTAIIDYQSVYDAPTLEEEVKMAAQRFSLSSDQQEVWLLAAQDRRLAETQARKVFESNADKYVKDGAYVGIRNAHNTFHETIIGHLSPAQKTAFETDRLVLNEKQRRLARLPPPPPPAPVDTVAPVDSAAIKAAEKPKPARKKSKKG